MLTNICQTLATLVTPPPTRFGGSSGCFYLREEFPDRVDQDDLRRWFGGLPHRLAWEAFTDDLKDGAIGEDTLRALSAGQVGLIVPPLSDSTTLEVGVPTPDGYVEVIAELPLGATISPALRPYIDVRGQQTFRRLRLLSYRPSGS